MTTLVFPGVVVNFNNFVVNFSNFVVNFSNFTLEALPDQLDLRSRSGWVGPNPNRRFPPLPSDPYLLAKSALIGAFR